MMVLLVLARSASNPPFIRLIHLKKQEIEMFKISSSCLYD